jgi:ABC-2 type transport system ATP-binding protein
MRQRLCLAHALVHDPLVLLLDEPASGLDPRARVEMRELLRELGAMGKTIVVSSHILAELAELCDSVGIIEQGRLVASGSLEELRRHATAGRMLHLRVLSDLEAAEVVLSDCPGIGQVYPQEMPDGAGGILEAEFSGDDEAVADLLAVLLAREVRVLSFSETTSDLEEVFLRLTQGEVA